MLLVIDTCNSKFSVKNDEHNLQTSFDTIICLLQFIAKLKRNGVNISVVLFYQAVFKYHGDVSNLISQDPCKHIACNQ